jgi:hypothetical protein
VGKIHDYVKEYDMYNSKNKHLLHANVGIHEPFVLDQFQYVRHMYHNILHTLFQNNLNKMVELDA